MRGDHKGESQTMTMLTDDEIVGGRLRRGSRYLLVFNHQELIEMVAEARAAGREEQKEIDFEIADDWATSPEDCGCHKHKRIAECIRSQEDNPL